MKNRTENISVRYRPQHLTKSRKKAIDTYQLPFFTLIYCMIIKIFSITVKINLKYHSNSL